MSYTIKEVQSRKELRKFVRFPDDLYRGCPQYVPALHSDQIHSLTDVSTLKYCEHKLWLVWDESGKVVGRVCASINPRYNERYDKKRARFGWFDTIDDFEVARLLIDTAEAWAREKGMTEIHGPLYYNTLGKQGMLVEGYENTPPFNCIYNYPYYNDFMARLGFVKECDWVQYKVVANSGVPEKVLRIAGLLEERYHIRTVDVNRLKKEPEMVRKFFKAYNRAFADTVYNFIPFTDEEIEEESKAMIPFVNNKTCSILMDDNDELVAFSICFPTISEALKKAKGHLFPFGWYHLLKAMHTYETQDLMVNGVVEEWRSKGASAIYYKDTSAKAIAIGTKWGITNPQIETNSAVNVWNSYEHWPFMRRRCYIKTID